MTPDRGTSAGLPRYRQRRPPCPGGKLVHSASPRPRREAEPRGPPDRTRSRMTREKSNHKIIDKVSVRLNETKDRYECTFTNLGLKNVPISSNIIKKHKKLLSGGVWCIIKIGYLYDENEDMPWLLQEVKPIQISNIDMDDILKIREEFTKEEWLTF